MHFFNNYNFCRSVIFVTKIFICWHLMEDCYVNFYRSAAYNCKNKNQELNKVQM